MHPSASCGEPDPATQPPFGGLAVEFRPPRATHVVVLLDVENLQVPVKADTFADIISACLTAAGTHRARLVAAVATKNLSKYDAVCADLGVEVFTAGDEESAADHALLDVAREEVAADRYTRFVVASGDHAFAPLAPDTVVVPAGQQVATQLEQQARRVVFAPVSRSAGQMSRTRARARYRARRKARTVCGSRLTQAA